MTAEDRPTEVVLRPMVRFVLYLIASVGSVVIAYTTAKGWTGDAEVVAWGGVAAIISGLAAANVPGRPRLPARRRPDAGVVDTRTIAVAGLIVAVVALLLLLLDPTIRL